MLKIIKKNKYVVLMPVFIILFAGIFSAPLARFLFTDISFLRIVFSFIYLLFIFCVAFFLFFKLDWSSFFSNKNFSELTLALSKKYLNQTLGMWILFIPLIFSVAGYAAYRIPMGKPQQAMWVSVLVDAPGETQPDLRISTSSDNGYVEFVWQPYSITRLGIRGVGDTGVIKIKEIIADGKMIPLDTIKSYRDGEILDASIQLKSGEKTLL